MIGKRIIYALIGIMATAIAIIGVFLPAIPTTFPVIVALWAFSRSSAKLSAGLEKIPILKTALVEANRYERERTVSRRAKIVSQSCAWISTIFVGILTQSLIITAIVMSIAMVCSLFMYLTPTSEDVDSVEVIAEPDTV